MSDSDSMTKRIMDKICYKRAGFVHKMILRSAVRCAIDAAASGPGMDENEALMLLEEAFACLTPGYGT